MEFIFESPIARCCNLYNKACHKNNKTHRLEGMFLRSQAFLSEKNIKEIHTRLEHASLAIKRKLKLFKTLLFVTRVNLSSHFGQPFRGSN